MSEITRAVRSAGRRLFIMEILRALVFSAFIALCLMTLLRLVQQTLGLAVAWETVAILAGSIAAAGTLVWSLIARPKDARSARILDERAELRESLSTALSIGTPKEPWAQLVVDSARQKAASVDIRRAIPIEAPSRWHWPLAAALALGIAWTLPQWDLLGKKAKREEEAARQQEVIAVSQTIEENKKKLDEMLAKVAPDLKADQAEGNKPDATEPTPIQKPEQLRAAEIKRLTDLTEKLEAKAGGEKGMQAEALKNIMAQLRHPGDSPMNDLFKSLSKGDFSQANQALSDMKAQLAKNDLSEEEKKKLADAMQKLADQLQKNADASKELAKALEQAGADPQQAAELAKQLAANPDLARKALEAMKNLSPEQKEQLAKQLTAKAKAAKQASKMAQSMSQCSKGLCDGEMGEASDAMSEMGGQLSEMEMSEAEMKAMAQTMDELRKQMLSMCQGGNCNGEGEGKGEGWQTQTGQWREGDSNRMGGTGGGGGPGKGQGDRSGSTPTDFAAEQQKLKTKTGKGPIIGKQYVRGEQIVGESSAEFVQVVESSGKVAAEALSNGEVPPELRKTVQSYFGALKKQAEKTGETKPAAK
jgi:cytochrome c556